MELNMARAEEAQARAEMNRANGLECQARAINNLIIATDIGGGFVYDPKSVVEAITSSDLSKLHR
jgi:hypothetical protein